MTEKEKKQKITKTTRSIFLSGHIDEESTKDIIEKLIELEKDNPLEDVFLYIDSYGGYIDSMFAVIDTMNLIKCDVQTICVGKAISAGAVILAAGKKGKRFITPHGRTMLHQAIGFAGGETDYVEIRAKEQRRLQNQIYEFLAKQTGKSFKKIQEDCRLDRYMSAKESVIYGLCDDIIESRK